MAESTLTLSVVVVPLEGHTYLDRCLRALTQQTGIQDVEIIVPYDQKTADVATLRKQFASVQYVAAPGSRTYAELRAIGVTKARGALIALTEDHCIPGRDWCAQIVQAHTGPYAAIGGAVEKAGADTAVNWALYLADYVRYMNPVPSGYAHQLSDCNVSYKRTALDAIQPVWQVEFHEPSVHRVLQAQGQALWLSPQIVVHQQRSMRLSRALWERYAFGRLFGSERVAAMTPLRRCFYVGLTLFLPGLLVGRVASHVYRKRHCVGAFVRALPVLMLLSILWAWGELVGYVTGSKISGAT